MNEQPRQNRAKELTANIRLLIEKGHRGWLTKTGREDVLDFKDDEIKKLKECFNSLDADGGGSIGLEELEDPLIGLGFAPDRKVVEDMINDVDEDANIEFNEFLKIIKNSKGGSGHGAAKDSSDINDFFKQMTAGEMGSGTEKDLSFNMLVQTRRRKHMLDAILLKEDAKDPAKS